MAAAAMLSRYPVRESIISLFGDRYSLKPPGFCFYFPSPVFASRPPKGVPFSTRMTALFWEAV